jgi:nucleotide-binding universal stress UspA family protein
VTRVKPNLLVAVDLEPPSGEVLGRAIEIATATSSTLTVLHAVDAGVGDPSVDAESVDQTSAHEYLVRQARAALENIVRARGISRVQIATRVEPGPASAVILNVALELHARLIIIGLSNRTTLRSRTAGSTADRIIRSSPNSVLVVKRPREGRYRYAVVGIDFSPQAEAAVTEAAVLSPDASLQLVHVTGIPLSFHQALLRTGTSEEEIDRYGCALVKRSKERLEGMAKKLLRQTTHNTRVFVGDPGTVLVRLSRTRRVDMIAVGPHGHGVILQALLGSVAHKLLREAACDILISRQRADLAES